MALVCQANHYPQQILRPWQTRTQCSGHIAAHDASWARKRAGHKMNVVFPCRTNCEIFPCCGHKMFLNKIRNIFCVQDKKFVSATNVARESKRGNIFVGNNVSLTMTVSSFARALKITAEFLAHTLFSKHPRKAASFVYPRPSKFPEAKHNSANLMQGYPLH